MEEDLPIDIQTGKLVDWLVSRHHVKKSWPKAVQVIREKINNAIQDMPEHPDVTRLLSGSFINYFHCLQIIEILRETEKESKNIFGWYTSQRMKDWQEVVRLYEADNVYLAEASQYLIRNVNYEVPSLKKQIARCRQIQEDCSKKIEDNNKGSATAKDKYGSSCRKIGITGENIKEELASLLNNLPEKFSEIARNAKKLKDARELYEDFIQFVVSPSATCLPLLNFIIEHGNTTLYEFKYGEPPVSIQRPQSEFLINETDNENIASLNEESNEIDFGIEVELETGDIDWGNVDTDTNDNQIDFGEDIDCSDITSSEIVVESSGVDGGVASGKEAQSLLMSETTRTQFVNDLFELEGFLSQRIIELEADDNIVSLSLFSNAPRSLQYQNVETITEYISILRKIVQELTSMKMQHLYMIGTSERYVDRLAETLRSHLVESDRLLGTIDGLKQKSEEASLQQHLLSQQMQLIISRTKELQENIEKQISQKYKNRTVNLMGGIRFL